MVFLHINARSYIILVLKLGSMVQHTIALPSTKIFINPHSLFCSINNWTPFEVLLFIYIRRLINFSKQYYFVTACQFLAVQLYKQFYKALEKWNKQKNSYYTWILHREKPVAPIIWRHKPRIQCYLMALQNAS